MGEPLLKFRVKDADDQTIMKRNINDLKELDDVFRKIKRKFG